MQPENVLFWNAYHSISRSRQYDRHQFTDGKQWVARTIPKALPISEIAAYCEFVGMDDLGQRIRLMESIQAMDAAFLDWHAKNSR